jgi:hypothetical protein
MAAHKEALALKVQAEAAAESETQVTLELGRSREEAVAAWEQVRSTHHGLLALAGCALSLGLQPVEQETGLS